MLNMKKIFPLLFIFFSIKTFCQNKQVLYNFAELPQTLLLNPGAETNYKFHIGVPLLSGFSAEIGTTGFVISDLFVADGRPFNDKVSEVLNKLSVNDHGKFNFQIDFLNGGFRLDDKNYFSFGFYEEFDGILYFPKDLVTLFTEGNSAYLNKNFDLAQVLYKVDALGVLHFGATKKINEKLTVGGRFKLYSSALNMESLNNSGTFTTVNGNNNIYTHYEMADGGNFWIVEDADTESFEVIGDCYAKDKNFIFGERAMKLDSIDYKTFKTCFDCGCFAKDKNGYFFWDEKMDENDFLNTEETLEIYKKLQKL